MVLSRERHVGWRGDNLLVEDARRPFIRRVTRLLQVDGLPAVAGLPSERRMAAGIDTLGFYTYPLLFYTSFPNVSLAQLRLLSTCGSYLFDHVLCVDELCDRPSQGNSGTILLSASLHREAMLGLAELFPPSSRFWGHHGHYYEQFCRSVLSEGSKHRNLVGPYSRQDLEMLYAGKAAVAKSCLAALAVLDGDEETLAQLAASHDAFYVGFQLADDLDDWRLDYERGHYSYPLTQALLRAGWERRVESGERPPAAEVGDLLLRSGAVEEARTLALGYLDRSESMLGDMADGSWQAAIRTTRERVRRLEFDPTGDAGRNAAQPGRAAPSGAATELWTGAPETATPIAGAWRGWLDPAREPRVVDDAILEEQRRMLRAAGPVRTIDAALCQVGLAIHASLRAFPEHHLSKHLGVQAGELEWFRRHDPWLDALLAISQEEPPEMWTAADPAVRGPVPGWVPPAVGRYLGYRLVRDSLRGEPDTATPTMEAVLRHHRRRSVA